jgi:hypothetical protein
VTKVALSRNIIQFARMSKSYEQEQGEIGKRIKVLRSELKKGNQPTLHRRYVFRDRPALHKRHGIDVAHGNGAHRPY